MTVLLAASFWQPWHFAILLGLLLLGALQFVIWLITPSQTSEDSETKLLVGLLILAAVGAGINMSVFEGSWWLGALAALALGFLTWISLMICSIDQSEHQRTLRQQYQERRWAGTRTRKAIVGSFVGADRDDEGAIATVHITTANGESISLGADELNDRDQIFLDSSGIADDLTESNPHDTRVTVVVGIAYFVLLLCAVALIAIISITAISFGIGKVPAIVATSIIVLMTIAYHVSPSGQTDPLSDQDKKLSDSSTTPATRVPRNESTSEQRDARADHRPLLNRNDPDRKQSETDDTHIHFVCSSCKKKLKVKVRQAGKTKPCPKCQVPVDIPSLVHQEPKRSSRCPECKFAYSWDGRECGHCGYQE